MKISFIKYKNDVDRYKFAKGIGMDVYEIEKLEDIDNKLEELESRNYNMIFIPNNLASFSEKILNKYQYSDNIKIILTPSNEKDV